jgi:hypothetical protein
VDLIPQARRAAGYRWFNSLPAAQAVQCLVDAGLDATAAADLGRQRPLTAVTHPELIGVLLRENVTRSC